MTAHRAGGDGAGMSSTPESYEIRVRGHLAARWAARFDGMTLTPHEDGTTVIHGPVTDQAALHGLLRALSDLGLPLLAVTPAPAADAHLRPSGPRP